MRRVDRVFTSIAVLLSLSVATNATDLTKSYSMPDASKIIKNDLLAKPKKYTMPKGCISKDVDAIARGEYIFHNLNGKKAKKNPPKGLVKFVEKKGKDGKKVKKPKQFGNCVACHNIEGAKGAGNIGPDLSNYKKHFIDTKARDTQFVFQKIADARIDNPKTHMTINLTTGLFSEREVCDIASYIVSDKSKKEKK